MKLRIVILLLLSALGACNLITEPPEPPVVENDFKVHTIYVVPQDKNYTLSNVNRVAAVTFEMQRWYQTATGGLTFEILDEENLLEVYFTEKATQYYEEDWWGLLLNEMKDNGLFVESKGTITMVWIEGINQINEDALAVGATMCDNNCGAALLPIDAILTGDWIPTDLGPALHEMGHTFGLTHPLEQADLPVSAADSAILNSLMCQGDIRLGKTSHEHGFLTTEKAHLKNNPFLKANVPLYQKFWTTNIINYPITGDVPEITFAYDVPSLNTVQFSVSAPAGSLYYWYFGDGSTSSEKEPLHWYSSGLYSTTLMVTAPNNMATRVSQYIDVP